MLAWECFIGKTVAKHPKNPKHVWRKWRGEEGKRSWIHHGKEDEILQLWRQPSWLDTVLTHWRLWRLWHLGSIGSRQRARQQQPRGVWAGSDDLQFWTWTPKAWRHLASDEFSQLRIYEMQAFLEELFGSRWKLITKLSLLLDQGWYSMLLRLLDFVPHY